MCVIGLRSSRNKYIYMEIFTYVYVETLLLTTIPTNLH